MVSLSEATSALRVSISCIYSSSVLCLKPMLTSPTPFRFYYPKYTRNGLKHPLLVDFRPFVVRHFHMLHLWKTSAFSALIIHKMGTQWSMGGVFWREIPLPVDCCADSFQHPLLIAQQRYFSGLFAAKFSLF